MGNPSIYAIKKLLAVRGKNVTWLANRLGTTATIVQDVFIGRSHFRVDRLLAIADILEVGISELFVDDRKWESDARLYMRHSMFSIMFNKNITARDVAYNIGIGLRKTSAILYDDAETTEDVAKAICRFVGVDYDAYKIVFNINLQENNLI